MSDSTTLASLLRRNAESRPGKTAIVYRGKHHTFSGHYQRAVKLANALLELGCQPGDRVAILAKNCIQYLELYSACELAGIIIVPVNFRLSGMEVNWVCGNTRPLVFFYSEEYSSFTEELAENNKGIRHFVRIEDRESGDDEYEELVQGGSSTVPAYQPAAGDAACIIHTSGTTGKAKGAVLGQAGLYGVAEAISSDAALDENDFGLIMQPLFHVGAKFLQLAHHFSGAAIRLESGFDTRAVWQILQNDKVTTIQLVPTMLALLLDERQGDDYPQTNLRTIFYSTAPIRESLLRRGLAVFGQVFLQQYGSTEAGQISSLAKQLHISKGPGQEQQWLKSAGKADPRVKIKILDGEGRQLGENETGEICVSNPWSMLGYWEEDASSSLTEDGYLRMGDMGYLDEQGFLYIVDRKKDMIISGGENIYPREVELALQNHPAVAEAAVIGVPDERWGESVLAVVVCNDGNTVTESELIKHCQQEIASYKKPKTVMIVDTLPRNSMGKIDKPALRAPWWSEQQGKLV